MPAIPYSDLNANNRGPAIGWRFFCTMPAITGATISPQRLAFYVERVSAPHPGIDFEAVPFNSGDRYFPIKRTMDNVTISFMEDANYRVIQYMRSWKNQIVDNQGNYGLPANYKQTILLQPIDHAGNTPITFQWDGCSPVHVDAYDFDGSASHHISCNVTFNIDQPAGIGFDSNSDYAAGLFSNFAADAVLGVLDSSPLFGFF